MRKVPLSAPQIRPRKGRGIGFGEEVDVDGATEGVLRLKLTDQAVAGAVTALLGRDIYLAADRKPQRRVPPKQTRVLDQLAPKRAVRRGPEHFLGAGSERSARRFRQDAFDVRTGNDFAGIRALERGGVEHQVGPRKVDRYRGLIMGEAAEALPRHVGQQKDEEQRRQADREQAREVEPALGRIALAQSSILGGADPSCWCRATHKPPGNGARQSARSG